MNEHAEQETVKKEEPKKLQNSAPKRKFTENPKFMKMQEELSIKFGDRTSDLVSTKKQKLTSKQSLDEQIEKAAPLTQRSDEGQFQKLLNIEKITEQAKAYTPHEEEAPPLPPRPDDNIKEELTQFQLVNQTILVENSILAETDIKTAADLNKKEDLSLARFFTPKLKKTGFNHFEVNLAKASNKKLAESSQLSATQTRKANQHNHHGVFYATANLKFSPNLPKTPESKPSQSNWEDNSVNMTTPLWSNKNK